jgi:LPXTG-motif cell wall-anchored protein
MSKPIALAILAVGIVLLVWGINASNSAGSEVTEALTGSPTDKSIWLIALGALGAIAGAFSLFRRRA